eukprot:CAMPEP_0198267810 /NCGR_PEP_ID=MMETSP1447-20131203/34597_1 /TAXON_ID=420782 /ORGANISM="Chaetoceros dichaeta, Strain CCMP1751" /LENGTH=104 /DNA_ID=CAMNT_0043958563 /DNA_START=117 /DNA_END=431 /DNA_ORIENTATION=+
MPMPPNCVKTMGTNFTILPETTHSSSSGVLRSAILSITPSPTIMQPCSVQANVGIRTISSEEEELCEKQQLTQTGGGDNHVVCQKSTRGGPRIKMLKERTQKVV